ncbi:unnamed protein product [Meganyctiphanes norvegica]|uniref:Uncharacterized protein n=1 Tax=Meganyctiphanes norvegica TaxID=48144 RepID=A0AAV2PUY1_MEGNR
MSSSIDHRPSRNDVCPTKTLKKTLVRICCCGGCLKQATFVFGIIDIGLAALLIFMSATFLYSYKVKINIDLFHTNANNLKNIIIYIIIVMQSINILACILLIYGNQSEQRRNYICPYVIMGFIRLLGIFLTIVLLIFGRQWKLLLNSFCGMVYLICSLHVVGERDKELANQLASNLKLSKPSTSAVPISTDINIDIITVNQQGNPIFPKESRKYTMSPKIDTRCLKKSNRLDRELLFTQRGKNKIREDRNISFTETENNKSTQSALALCSKTISSSIDFESYNPELSHLPLSSQKSRSKRSISRRPKSSISLTSLNTAVPKEEDPLLSKSVSAVSFAMSASPISISPSLPVGNIGTNNPGSTSYFLVNNEVCREIEMDAINGSSCKLCQKYPSSFVYKGNINVCELQNKRIHDERSCENIEKPSISQVTLSQNSKSLPETPPPTYISVQIENSKDHGCVSEALPTYVESVTENDLQIGVNETDSFSKDVNDVQDNEDNVYMFSQTVKGDHEIDLSR